MTSFLKQALEIRLDPAQIKDTQCIAAYQRLSGIKRPALRRLVKLAFDVDIQQGFHDPVSAAWKHTLNSKKWSDGLIGFLMTFWVCSGR